MLRVIWLSCLMTIGLISMGQESVSSAGNQISSSQGSVTFVVGQVNGTPIDPQVKSGVLQPYVVDLVLSVEGSIEVNVFPNPTEEQLFIEGNFSSGGYSFLIHNMQGQFLREGQLQSNKTPISLSDFTSDTYFISIQKGSQKIKTFRIVKSH